MRPALSVAYVAAAAAATVTGALGPRRAAAITKPLPMLILAAHTVAGAKRRGVAENAALAGILGFSMAGDRLMLAEEFEPPASESPESGSPTPGTAGLDAKDRYLRWGATLFAGAQLSYAATMWRAGARPSVATMAPRVALLAESATVLARNRPGLLPVLGGYGNTLATMSALASDMPGPQPRMRAGGWAFLLSDLAIINRRHLVTEPRLRVAGEAWVLASYFAAQYLLIGGLTDPAVTRPLVPGTSNTAG
ncbi:lysoplasmalogenase [Gordonia sp. zg691]|uniref:lysoplasmalogenase family protein n=1 Tax=Gordonia jinghuaiqii TaxID=2758710 RepID=UPI0016625B7C|nr:lysoplasmalogenase family protein [Gordonia jinghuaiqii]MBD0859710.1 lysoplasmalogenase [Gordonia jinghuaiqii]